MNRRVSRRDDGASAVELALVLPILLVLVLGIMEFGWAFNGWITVTGAAREGARIAAVDEDNAEVQSAVLAHTTTFPTSPTVTIDRSAGSVSVTVVGQLPPLVGFFRSSDWHIEADAVMRREY